MAKPTLHTHPDAFAMRLGLAPVPLLRPWASHIERFEAFHGVLRSAIGSKACLLRRCAVLLVDIVLGQITLLERLVSHGSGIGDASRTSNIPAPKLLFCFPGL